MTSAAQPPGANARGVALQLVRCWELVDHLRTVEKDMKPLIGYGLVTR